MNKPKAPPKAKAHPKLLGIFSNCCCILPAGALLSGEILRIEYPINKRITPTKIATTPAIIIPPPLLIRPCLQERMNLIAFKFSQGVY